MPGEVTRLLAEQSRGNRQAESRLWDLIYKELRRIAAKHMRGERSDHTLQPTALVNEAYLKLVGQQNVSWQSKTDFFRMASRLMRHVLVDHARKHARHKRRGGLSKSPLNEEVLFLPGRGRKALDAEELIDLDWALSRLAKLDRRQSQVVELRFFGGLSVEETAAELRISAKTVKREWAAARPWLHREIRERKGE